MVVYKYKNKGGIEIPKDNGMRMKISIIKKYNEGVKQYEEKFD